MWLMMHKSTYLRLLIAEFFFLLYVNLRSSSINKTFKHSACAVCDYEYRTLLDSISSRFYAVVSLSDVLRTIAGDCSTPPATARGNAQ